MADFSNCLTPDEQAYFDEMGADPNDVFNSKVDEYRNLAIKQRRERLMTKIDSLAPEDQAAIEARVDQIAKSNPAPIPDPAIIAPAS